MGDAGQTERQAVLAAKIAYWAKFIGFSAFISIALLYLTTVAEFSEVRAVYEAY